MVPERKLPGGHRVAGCNFTSGSHEAAGWVWLHVASCRVNAVAAFTLKQLRANVTDVKAFSWSAEELELLNSWVDRSRLPSS